MKDKISFYIRRIKEGRLQEMAEEIRWIYGYGRKYFWAMVFYTALGLVGTVLSLLMGLVSMDLVDIITGYKSGEVIKYFALMITYGLVSAVVSQITDYASNYISMKVDTEIKADVFEKILETDWESLTTYHSGDLLTRWSSDASTISGGVLSFVPNAINYFFKFFSAFAMIIYYDWTFAVFAFLSIPVSLILSKTLINRMVRNNKRSAQMSARMTGFNQEAFSNIQFIKSFDLIKLYIQRLKGLQEEYIGMRLEFQKMSVWTSLLMTTVGLVVSYSAYGWGIYRVWSGAISYGAMTLFLGLSSTLTATVSNLTSLVPSTITLTTSARRLMDILDMPREDYSADETVNAFEEKHAKNGISLVVDGVDYAYHTGTMVFRGASLEAHPHEVIALVGPSGQGKTTMMRLILSLISKQGGELRLEGGTGELGVSGAPGVPGARDYVNLSPSTRHLFSYVPQGNTMFSGTISENMRNIKPDATDEEIVEALKLADAWEFVEKLPNGIDSEIKERGGGFSEGQAQRMSIARALLRKSPLLLLDEATSALDVATERRVLGNIMKDEYPRTVVVTTHRPSVLSVCRRVYKIDDFKCVLMSDEDIEKEFS